MHPSPFLLPHLWLNIAPFCSLTYFHLHVLFVLFWAFFVKIYYIKIRIIYYRFSESFFIQIYQTPTWCRSSSTSSESRGFPALNISPFPSCFDHNDHHNHYYYNYHYLSYHHHFCRCKMKTCGSLMTIWFVIGQLIPTEFHLDKNRWLVKDKMR